jgi:hypothetical protein
VLLAAVAVAVAVLSTSVSAGGVVGKPALRVLDRQPLVVRGSGFAPRERVVVSAFTTSRKIVERPVATATGTFTARFELAYGTCTGIQVVRAVGARSATVTIRSVPTIRDCPPPATP